MRGGSCLFWVLSHILGTRPDTGKVLSVYLLAKEMIEGAEIPHLTPLRVGCGALCYYFPVAEAAFSQSISFLFRINVLTQINECVSPL